MKIEDLPNIQIERLPRFNYEQRRQIPNKAGLYFAFLGEELVYIGQSNTIRDRVRNHKIVRPLASEKGYAISFLVFGECWREIESGFLNFAEQHLIHKYRPRLNTAPACSPFGQYGKFFKTEIGRDADAGYLETYHRLRDKS